MGRRMDFPQRGGRMAKRLSRVELEYIAGTITEKYYALPQKGRIMEAVDPERLASEVVGLNVSYLPLCQDDSVMGLSAFADLEIQIQLDNGTVEEVRLGDRDIVIDSALLEERNRGRRNFTMAHETAHHILAMMYPMEYGAGSGSSSHVLYRRNEVCRDWEEWQADTMAAALLMPSELVRFCMYFFGVGEALGFVDALDTSFQHGRFCDMANYMGVSKKALEIRLRRMKLL